MVAGILEALVPTDGAAHGTGAYAAAGCPVEFARDWVDVEAGDGCAG